EQGHLVQVLHQHIVRQRGQMPSVVARGRDRECIPPTGTMHLHAVVGVAWGSARPGRYEEGHGVPARGQTPEHLVEVRFGAAGLRVVAVLPVDHEQPQAAPQRSRSSCRISASRTPFTKRGLSAVPYFSARVSASWIETRGGISSRYSISAA